MAGGAEKKKGGKDKGQKKAKTPKAGADRFDDASKASSKNVDILDDSAMENAYNICHNVQDLLYFRGFFWEGHIGYQQNEPQ